MISDALKSKIMRDVKFSKGRISGNDRALYTRNTNSSKVKTQVKKKLEKACFNCGKLGNFVAGEIFK